MRKALTEIAPDATRHGRCAIVAQALGLTPQAVLKWDASGFLPRTEWTGETNYRQVIAGMAQTVTADDLLQRRQSAA